jgi:hypothetical protein
VTETKVPVKKPFVTKSPPAAPVVKNYQEALTMYRTSGYYLQIVNCRANPIYPTSLVLKKGASFMVDNRDDRAHKFMVGKSAYTVKAYGFVIATANDVGTYNMTCDGGGSAGLNVQP